jgi:hypothetical protein
MVDKYGGFLIIFDEENRRDVLEEYKYYGRFSDVLSAPDWKPKQIELCAISFDQGNCSSIALVTRGRRVATAKYRVEFHDFVDLDPTLSFRELEKNIESPLDKYFSFSSAGRGRRVPPKTWGAILNAIKTLRPESKKDIERLERIRGEARIQRSESVFEIVAQEKDAVGLALEIFGFNRKDGFHMIQKKIPPDPIPFLADLKEVGILEDHMLEHDARVFGNWSIFQDCQIGAVRFFKNNEYLTVMNVNRSKIENTLGVDLVYYQHKYKSYVMVQYKRLLKDDYGNFYYRPDASFRKEVAKMNHFDNILHKAKGGEKINPAGYRLNIGPFYFKFCNSTSYNPTSTELLSGMYLPLEYWDILEKSGKLSGPKNGIRLTYENSDRHFNNTHFVNLVERGWIGSRIKTAYLISKIIKNSLQVKKSIILGMSSSKEDNKNDERLEVEG